MHPHLHPLPPVIPGSVINQTCKLFGTWMGSKEIIEHSFESQIFSGMDRLELRDLFARRMKRSDRPEKKDRQGDRACQFGQHSGFLSLQMDHEIQ
jgi:hypothetical protein